MSKNLLLENYNTFFTENKEYTENPESARNLITDAAEYDAYTSSLLEGYDESTAKEVQGLFDRNREYLLESASSMLGSPEAVAYATSSFALILDVFTDDLLKNAVTVAPSSTPTKTVTRTQWEAKIIDLDGSSQSYTMPNRKTIIRPGVKRLVIDTGSANLFTLAGVTGSTDDYRLIQRNFRVVKATINDGTTDHEIAISSNLDARGTFTADGVCTVDAGNVLTFNIQGSVNFSTGQINHAMIEEDKTGSKTYTLTSIDVKLRILGQGNSKGTVKAQPKAKQVDFIMDVSDSFEIDNSAELIQDWSSVFSLDVFNSLRTAVKNQIALNKNFDVVDVLELAEPVMAKFGASKTIDMDVLATKTQASKFSDFYTSMIPAIMSVVQTVSDNSGMAANYIICDSDTAVALKSMQDMALKFGNSNQGTMGGASVINDFVSLKILPTPAIDTSGRMYIVAKSVAQNETAILDLEYQPLYFINEVTNGKTRLFVRSRSDVRIIKEEAVGTVLVQNLQNWAV